MIVRLSAAVLLNGLVLGTPVLAETPALDSDRFLSVQETAPTVLIETESASAASPPTADVAVSISDDLAGNASQELASAIEAVLEPDTEGEIAATIDLEAALAPALFADPSEGETMSWIAADLDKLEQLSTGSLQNANLPSVADEDADFVLPVLPPVNPLTDDAFPTL